MSKIRAITYRQLGASIVNLITSGARDPDEPFIWGTHEEPVFFPYLVDARTGEVVEDGKEFDESVIYRGGGNGNGHGTD